MELIKNMLESFNKKYSNWMWLLVRAIICFCTANLIIYGLATIVLFFYPFISVFMGNGFAGFLIWYFIPVLFFIDWLSYDIIKIVYEEYIEDDGYVDDDGNVDIERINNENESC